MASVAFVRTEHDEAGPSPAKLPQVPGYFLAQKHLAISHVVVGGIASAKLPPGAI